MPRPLMTAASKSALIEQLKARHSSQQHKLQELAVRVEQTRKDNRRLRNALLLLVGRGDRDPGGNFSRPDLSSFAR